MPFWPSLDLALVLVLSFLTQPCPQLLYKTLGPCSSLEATWEVHLESDCHLSCCLGALLGNGRGWRGICFSHLLFSFLFVCVCVGLFRDS